MSPAPTNSQSPYLKVKRILDHFMAAALRVSALPLKRHREILRSSAKQLRSGERTLVGPPACAHHDDTISPGLLNEATICEWMNMEYSVHELAESYRQKLGPRRDLSIALRWLWALAIARDAKPTTPSPIIHLLGVAINNSAVEFANRMLRNVIEICKSLHMAREVGGDNVFIPRSIKVSFVNANNLNAYVEHAEYRRALLASDFILPDGIGVKIAARMTKQALKQNLNGTDLFPLLMRSLTAIQGSIFLLGAEPKILERAAASIRQHFPDVQIAGMRDGYFHKADEPEIARQINDSGADVVIVGMGTPRQELWMQRNAPALRVSAIFCLGGLLDFLGGKNHRAPMWMRQAGLEWVYRIIQEPRRMWRRYVIGNPVFLWRVWRHGCHHLKTRKRSTRP